MEEVISIIVPIFNVEKYLPQCLESIINQSYRNLEIILVNDGSTDRSGDICNQYAERDSRIRVIHQPNGGVSNARNTGLQEVRGEYIGFVDPDDYIHRDMYKKLIYTMKQYSVDITEAGFLKVHNHEYKADGELNGEKRIYDKKSAIVSTIVDHDCKNYLWNKLYKRSLWENIEFPEGKIYEDAFVTFKVVNKANMVVRIEEELYYYFQRVVSLSNSQFSIANLNHCEALEEMMEFMERYYPDVLPIVAVKYFEASQHWLYLLYEHKKTINQADDFLSDLSQKLVGGKYIKQIKKPMKSLCKEILKDNYAYLIKDKVLVCVRLFFLSQSLSSFKVCNQFINNLKKVTSIRKNAQH